MDTTRTDDPWALRLEVSAADRNAGPADWALVGVVGDGGERLIAVGGAVRSEEPPYVLDAVALSPSRGRAAVRVGGDVWTIELASGAVVSHVAFTPDEDDGTAFAMMGGLHDRILVWDEEERAASAAAGPGRELRALLAEGLSLTVRGAVEDDGGEASSGGSGMHVYWAHGTPEEDVRAAIEARRRAAERAVAAELRVRVAVVAGDREIVVHDETTTPRTGFTRLQWPVHAGPRGVLLRRSHVTVEAGPQAEGGGGIAHSGFEVLHPWLVAPDGTVTVLPFELGNAPIATLPDGRFLLPCYAAMWWDGADEALSALSDDGETESLRLDGEPLTPSAIVHALDPSLVVPRADDYDYEDAWAVAGARLRDGVLVLALSRGDDPDDPWLVVALALDGLTCGPPRLIAAGRTPPATVVRFAV